MRVVLAEDSVLLREGLARLLAEDGHEVVAGIGQADLIVPTVEAHRPELLVTDVRMPPHYRDDGLKAAVAAHTAYPGLCVLVLSNYVEVTYARELFAHSHGGVGYLLKDRIEDLGVLHDAMDRLARGGTVIDPEVIAHVLSSRDSGPLRGLTARELEVLELMAEGRANAAIGQALALSPGAVEKHVTAIFAKLGLAASAGDNRRVLAVLAYLGAGQA